MKKILFTLIIMCLPAMVWAAQSKAVIKGTAPDSKISGEVLFNEKKGGLLMTANISNVPPGKHGFHIHEIGSCEDSGKAAGGHFNPDKAKHGFIPMDGLMNSHAGDMGNIIVNKHGKGRLKIFLPGLTLKEGKHAVIGKSIILHEKTDDFGQPTGNAGGRIGCGIIEAQESK